ncbi:MAG TPA: tetratricopeptide repeat protein [Vicinamibacterales bacterium]|nr:tetratricopeptide repeat protein [Vicinamibacterales bacterium]
MGQGPRLRTRAAQCVAIDPNFAPAWARLGRCYRLIGKYLEPSPDSAKRAEETLRRALELNPRLTIAHKLFASLEADNGHAERAMVRLLGEARRHGNDPELYAGLVHACRNCGLFDESLAAHAHAHAQPPLRRVARQPRVSVASGDRGSRPAQCAGRVP